MSEAKKKAPSINAELKKELENAPTVSAKMRLLSSKGYSRADIARILNKRYQHVKNVLDAPLKKKSE